MKLTEIRERWSRFRGIDQLQGGLGAFGLPTFATICWVVTIVKGGGWTYTITDVPVALRPIAYLTFLVLLWSGFQFFDRLLPHAFHLNSSFWVKVGWIGLLLFVWPLGPPLYYFIVYRKTRHERVGNT